MKTLSTWMLGGALAASLTWNWKLYRQAEPAPPCDAGSCEFGAELGLDPEQRFRLDALCARSCGEADELERRADEQQRELLASLAGPEADPAAAARLVDEIGELRRRALAACVAGVLEVRQALGGEEVRALLERCQHTRCK